jgi:transposase
MKKPLANIPKYYYTSCLGQSHAGGIKEMLAVAEINYIRQQVNTVKEIIDEWIKEDLKKKKKFRRTAKRMWEQLKELHDFQGSDRTVRHYVSKRREELLNEADQAALPLESIPGTAQVDFGEAPFIYEGDEIVLPFLVVSFPNSNSFYFQVFPSQNKECFS